MTELSNGTTNPNDLNTENPVNKKTETNDVETIQNIENTEINPTNNDILDSINLGEQNETIDINDIMDVLGVPGENSQTDNQKTENIQIGRTEYEKQITPVPFHRDLKKEQAVLEEKIIYDINLVSLEILLTILLEKQYDFATFEPSENHVKINFRKDKVVKETRYIKYPTYTNILFKAKSITNLTIEETKEQQDGTGEIVLNTNTYKLITKVVPSDFGSKLFIKIKEADKKVTKKAKQKMSMGQIFTYLGVIAFIALIIGGAFISFVVMNAKTVEDVKFFYSLGINLNDINNFILRAVTVIFSVLIFIETLFLIIYLFKFALTKKEFKQKKIRNGILAAIILILASGSGSAWLMIDKKIRALPNWQEMAYGDVQLYDNTKLISEGFDKGLSLLSDTTNLIGPMQIKFDLNFFAQSEERKGLTIKKYIWDFGNGEIKESPIPTMIYDFKEKGNYEVKVTLQEVDMQGKTIEKNVENIPNINIGYSVIINEKTIASGGKLVDFDATSLSELGKIEWYFMDNLEKPIWTGEKFIVGKPIFTETQVGMYIRRNDKTSEVLDKLFIISGDSETKLDGEIKYTRSLIDDLEYEFIVENAQNDIGNGIVEEYKWTIGDKEITKQGDVTNPTESSKIIFKFDSYGEKDIKVVIKNTAGQTREITAKVDIPKILRLSSPLIIQDEGVAVSNLKYEPKLNEYYINEIGVPTKLTLDARFIKTNNILYTLKKVSFDYNSDGDMDEVTKVGTYNADIEGNHTITVYYEFVNRRIADDVIKMKEVIYIEGIKKEAIITFDINKNSTYVPITVAFDASKSQVKNENIEKFIWDYGDGVSEERDAIVPGHKYTTPGDYIVKLKVITTSGKQYSTSRSLVLKPKPQSVKISSSMINAPVGQGIDFTSEESEGQIIGYFWDFGDGSTSVQANPTHAFKKAGTYTVTLKLDYANKNILEDKIEIKVTED